MQSAGEVEGCEALSSDMGSGCGGVGRLCLYCTMSRLYRGISCLCILGKAGRRAYVRLACVSVEEAILFNDLC